MCRFRFTSFSHNSPQILCHSEVSGPLPGSSHSHHMFEAPHIQSHEFTCVPPTPEICHRVLLFVAYLKSYSSVCLTLSTNLRTKANHLRLLVSVIRIAICPSNPNLAILQESLPYLPASLSAYLPASASPTSPYTL